MKQLLTAVSVAMLAACTTSNPDVVRRYETQRLSQVHDATVLSVRPVTVEGSQSGIGAGAGAVAGGVAGSSIGGHREGLVGGVLGAVVGGVIGNAVERGTTRENAVEIVVQLRNGERRAIVQSVGNETYAPGDPVVLVTTAGRTRIARAPQAGAPVYPAPAAYPAQPTYPAPAGYPNAPVTPVPVYPPSGPVPPRS
jgi:outer membrane lipoprotein SlyB